MQKVIKNTDLEPISTDILKLDNEIVPGSYDVPTTHAVAEALGEVVGGSEIAPTTGTRPSVEGDFVNKLIVVDGKVAKLTDVQDGTTTYVTTDIVDELNAMQWKDVSIPPLSEVPYTVPVHNHEHVLVSAIIGSDVDVTIQCDDTCDESTVLFQADPTDIRNLAVRRGNTNMRVFGRETLVGINVTQDDNFYLYSAEGSLQPTDFNEISVNTTHLLENAEGLTGSEVRANYFAVEIKKNYAIVHYV